METKGVKRANEESVVIKEVFLESYYQKHFEENFLNRKLAIGKVLTDDALACLPNIKLLMEEQTNWLNMLMIDDVCYPMAVKAFYSQLRIDKRLGFLSQVGGHKLNISEKTISNVFRIKSDGVEINSRKDWFKQNLLKEEDVSYHLTKKRTYKVSEIRVSQLSTLNRMIYHLIQFCLLPRNGGSDYMSGMDCMLLFYLTKGSPINFPRLMLDYMYTCFLNKKGLLPYGRLLTRILVHKKVELELFEYFHPNLYILQSHLTKIYKTYMKRKEDKRKEPPMVQENPKKKKKVKPSQPSNQSPPHQTQPLPPPPPIRLPPPNPRTPSFNAHSPNQHDTLPSPTPNTKTANPNPHHTQENPPYPFNPFTNPILENQDFNDIDFTESSPYVPPSLHDLNMFFNNVPIIDQEDVDEMVNELQGELQGALSETSQHESDNEIQEEENQEVSSSDHHSGSQERDTRLEQEIEEAMESPRQHENRNLEEEHEEEEPQDMIVANTPKEIIQDYSSIVITPSNAQPHQEDDLVAKFHDQETKGLGYYRRQTNLWYF